MKSLLRYGRNFLEKWRWSETTLMREARLPGPAEVWIKSPKAMDIVNWSLRKVAFFSERYMQVKSCLKNINLYKLCLKEFMDLLIVI